MQKTLFPALLSVLLVLSSLPAGAASNITAAARAVTADTNGIVTWPPVLTVRTVASGEFTGSGLGLTNLNAASMSSIVAIRAAIANRRYDSVVPVTTTIGAALAGITDASYLKKYMLYITNGTYNETITAQNYVDLIGQSRTGVVISSSSGIAPTIECGGKNCLLANFTVKHTFNVGDSGAYQYPIHSDGATAPDLLIPSSSTMIFFNITGQSLGTDAKHGIGFGLQGSTDNQRIYIVDCSFSSSRTTGIYGHNAGNSLFAVNAYILNSIGTGGAAGYGLEWQNTGSASTADTLSVFGSTFAGGLADVGVINVQIGAGETWIYFDQDTHFTTSSFVDPSKVVLVAPTISIPHEIRPSFGPINTMGHNVPIIGSRLYLIGYSLTNGLNSNLEIGDGTGASFFRLSRDNVNRFRIDMNNQLSIIGGKLGIGTATDLKALTLAFSDTNQYVPTAPPYLVAGRALRIGETSNTNGTAALIDFVIGGQFMDNSVAQFGVVVPNKSANGADIVFRTFLAGEAVRIMNSGNVGFGKTNALFKVDIEGTNNATLFSAGGTNGISTTWTNLLAGIATNRIVTVGGIVVTNELIAW